MRRRTYISVIITLVSTLLFTACIDDKYEDTKEAGEKYLEQNLASDTIQVLSEIIQYKVFYNNEYGLNLNTALTDEYSKVDISYTAYFLDGTVYETVPANSLPYYTALPYGLQEVLRKMKTGSKWKVWLPQSLCYGSDGVQNDDGSYVVDPYTSLIYEIEFLSFQY